jgi:hypothetical protein
MSKSLRLISPVLYGRLDFYSRKMPQLLAGNSKLKTHTKRPSLTPKGTRGELYIRPPSMGEHKVRPYGKIFI